LQEKGLEKIEKQTQKKMKQVKSTLIGTQINNPLTHGQKV